MIPTEDTINLFGWQTYIIINWKGKHHEGTNRKTMKLMKLKIMK